MGRQAITPLNLHTLPHSPDAPKLYAKSVRELLHPPSRFKTSGHEVHRDEQPHAETFDELAGAACVAIADAPIHGKHGHVKVVSDFVDVLQFAEVLFLLFGRVNIHAEFLAMYQAAPIVIGQEAGVPVVQVAGMEDAPALHFHRGCIRLARHLLWPTRHRHLLSLPGGASECLWTKHR